MNSKDSEYMLEKFERSLEHFFEAMKLREVLSLRIAKRTTYMVRFTLAAVLLLSIILIYLVKAMTVQMHEMSMHMSGMTELMASMDRNITVMPAMHVEMTRINQRLAHTNDTVALMSNTMSKIDRNTRVMVSMRDNMTAINREVSTMNLQLGRMNNSLQRMNTTVGHMDYGVNRIARPMSMIPFFNN